MKKLLLLSSCVCCLISSCNNVGTEHLTKSSSDKDSMSYAIGVLEAAQIKRKIEHHKLDLNLNCFMAGVYDVFSKDSISMSDEQAIAVINGYMTKIQEKYKQENLDFLAKNAEKSGVKTTESGLQYEIIEEGTGVSPGATDTVEVHYTGTLIDGTQFDSSRERQESFKTPLNRVIQGWTEGMQMMKEGAHYKFYIPSALGYGDERYAGPSIRPGSTLIFDVELLKVMPDKSPKEVEKPEAAE
jgi:FKBP-type peptidyl-prolyl cis-trans isomerase